MAIKYNHQAIEKKWQKFWEKSETWRAGATLQGRKSYILDMFPYPSAQGLHVGHPEGYTASDIVARYLRMKGFNVLHPMGFDAFGLPAENYAIKTGTHPAETTARNIDNMRQQIKSLGFSYDWSREVITSDPKYYKWTQWIFLQLFKHGLAYEALAPINWCPKDKTGLANEEVINGKCERCGTPVVKKNIKQWLVKITDERYIERLLHGLDKLDWPENIKLLQRNWIGRSEGAIIKFQIPNLNYQTNLNSQALNSKQYIEVFTTRPDTLFGATYMVLSPEHPLVNDITTPEQRSIVGKYQIEATRKSDLDRTDLAKAKTGVFTGAYAINPVNNKKIPIWIADYVLSSYGTGAIMAVPAHDERDYTFAKKYKLPIIKVIEPPGVIGRSPFEASLSSAGAYGHLDADLTAGCWTGDGTMVNSGQFDGMDSVEFKKKVVEWLNPKTDKEKNTCLVVHGIGGHKRENWFPWLKKESVKIGWETIVPTMPGEGHPTLESWNDFLRQYDQQINESSVLVGHSLGCASILYYLQESEKKVDTVIFVAPTNPMQHWDKLKKEYPDYDWDSVERMNQTQGLNWGKIRKQAKRFVIMHSDNDPYIPVESMAYYKKNLPEAEINLMPGKYHFSEAKGIKSLPEILQFFPKSSFVTAKAKAAINYKLRDWVFSRQRYWGEPIPIVHCDKCGNVPVPEEELPLELPKVKKYEPTGTGESPLAHVDKWVNVKCPQCGGKAKRETNTMPQWAGSNWYWLRYCDPHNDKQLADPEKLKAWLPVNLYVGGAEHAVLHLLYARFIYKFLFDIGVVPKECGDEPFVKLKNQGLILGEDNQKMSKSRGNVVNPDDVIKEFGADAMRMFEMFMGPFEDVKPWSTRGIVGVKRFLDRVWEMATAAINDKHVPQTQNDPEALRKLHQLIQKITKDVESYSFNTAVSSFMEFTNYLRNSGNISRGELTILLQLMHPFAPHITSELFELLHKEDKIKKVNLWETAWPKAEGGLLQNLEITLPIQINGKVRDQVIMPVDTSDDEIKKVVLEREKVRKWLEGKEPKQFRYIKGKIVSIVV